MLRNWLLILAILIEGVTGSFLAAKVAGDFIVGALFALHQTPSGSLSGGALVCGSIREQYGIQRVEAALYTLDQINNNSELLRGILFYFIKKINQSNFSNMKRRDFVIFNLISQGLLWD